MALLFTALLAGVSSPLSLSAQSDDGFLFREPRVTFGLKFGYAMPTAGSEIFDFVQDELTVERSDFNSSSLGAEMSVRVAPRVDLTFEIHHAESSVRSEFRDWVDADDLPIEQLTEFSRTPVTVGATVFLGDRGQRVSRLAWVPAALTPFVGGGVGLMGYSFVQSGDFVDFETLDIFVDYFQSSGTTVTAHGLAGLQFSVSPRMLISAEGRYVWARDDMSGDFVDFDALDLAGLQGNIGFKFRF